MNIFDLTAFVLIGICHIVLYLQLIGYERFTWKSILGFGLFLFVFLAMVLSATGYPEFNFIVMLLFLLGLGLLKQREGLPFAQSLYFALASLFLISLARMLLMDLLFRIVIHSSLPLSIGIGGLPHLIVACLLLLSLTLLRKKTGKLGRFVTTGPLYYASYVLLAAGMMALILISSPSVGILADLSRTYGHASLILAILLFLVILLLFFLSSHLSKEKMQLEHKRNTDKELLDYMEKLEVMHEELASFRHDYLNLMLSLDQGVRNRDMSQIEQVYRDVIKPASERINHAEYELVKLARIRVPALKSILSIKIIAAQRKGITVLLDVPHQAQEAAAPLADLVRMIAILLDNAIEEAGVSLERKLEIAFFEKDKEQLFIVRNSCHQQEVDLQAIYQKHYTSKEEQRGLGLFSLKRLVDAQPNIMLETAFDRPWFTQVLRLNRAAYEGKGTE